MIHDMKSRGEKKVKRNPNTNIMPHLNKALLDLWELCNFTNPEQVEPHNQLFK